MNKTFGTAAIAASLLMSATPARSDGLTDRIEDGLKAEASSIIGWRRDLHQNPELSNREFRTSKLVAEHLRKLGLTVETGIAHTGVIGLLKGGKPGPTIALRADMDALPVTEQVDLPFRSHATAQYRGETVGVMHACGHDSHTAVLMGVAEVLTKLRADLPGQILFIFQPSEEGAPAGEEGGASLMLKEGLFDRYKPEVAFGLHVMSSLHVGEIGYRSGSFMAGSDIFRIHVVGRQTHGAKPWGGIDPIVTAAQIINALQTVVSRQIDITANPAIVTIGAIKGGIRNNIIPDDVEMIGTIRNFDPQQREQIVKAMDRIVTNTAAANGATATMEVSPNGNPVTYNNPELTAKVLPTLRRVAGDAHVHVIPLVTGAEDFSYFGQKVPSVFFHVGITPLNESAVTAPSNHSPQFHIDESGIPLAARALAEVAVDYLTSARP